MSQADFTPPKVIWLTETVPMEFRGIPPGCFLMGSRGEYHDEEPRHWVQITNLRPDEVLRIQPFYLGTFPVTQRQFEVKNRDHTNGFPGRPDNPVEQIMWSDAQEFCDWLNKNYAKQFEGYTACLPTEAQWEYACRAGTSTEYYTGEGNAALSEAGWFSGNLPEGARSTQPVGQKQPNGFGLYDMHGNVDEWCRDVYDADAYKKRPDKVRDPKFMDGSVDAGRVIRGGSCAASAWGCRSAFRIWRDPGYRDRYQGFRVCLFPGPVE